MYNLKSWTVGENLRSDISWHGLGTRHHTHEILNVAEISPIQIHGYARNHEYDNCIAYHVLHGFGFLVNVFHFNQFDQEKHQGSKNGYKKIHNICV